MVKSNFFQKSLISLNDALNILQEREAKYAGHAPLDLLNRITDHKKAIALTKAVITGDLTEAEWQAGILPLTLSSALLEMATQITPDLRLHEQAYRQHIRKRFGEDAGYYIPLTGETTEVIPPSPAQSQALRSARRRRQRALTEYHEWIQAGQELKRVKLNTLREAVDKYPCIILLGDPGSGKTTALEHLAYEFTAESLRAGEPDILPLPLRLSEFGPGMTVPAFIEQVWGGLPDTGHWGAPELAANLPRLLEEGRLFFLFDALNEMPRTGYKERTQLLRQFIDKWSVRGNRFLVTCRVLDYGEELSGLQRVEIQPLNEAQIQTFIQKELPDDWPQLWDILIETDSQSKPHAERRLKSASRGVSNPKSKILEMARNPYILTMMIDIYLEDGQLGRNRAELMTRFNQILMSWTKEKVPVDAWLEAEIQREALSIMAFEMQKRAGSGTVVETGKIKRVLPEQVQPDPNWPPVATPSDQILNLAASANIIEMPVDRSSVRFYHQLLQEYYAARQMLKYEPETLQDCWRWPWLETEMPLWVRPDDNYDPLPPPPPTGWEETTILAAGLAAENDAQLVRALTEVNPVLAGRCLDEGKAKVEPAIRQAVIDRLLATIARPEVALRVRIAAGEVLGYLGDPRLGEMVTIPAGKFVMGGEGTFDGKPQHELMLPDYRIGKYAVTNAEYGRFIEAGGYQQQRWWTEAGWTWKEKDNWSEPDYWRDSRFNKPNQPVVGVSWYECVAYCRWLSADTGHPYRLPTEAEWEKAVRGVAGRVYPWGNEFEAARVNMHLSEQVVRTTTPVGIYSAGISPYGLYDGAGNVWEWCATKMSKAYPYDVKENEWASEYLNGTNVQVLRGGSWYGSGEFDARCACRGGDYPVGRNDVGGCRVAVPPFEF